MSTANESSAETTVQEMDMVAVRFAGDSGDGMQLTGTQFTNTTALVGNDLATLPDFPAEIRAPAGTLAGVSGFQIQFGNRKIYTPGDRPDALVAMNPAALKANLPVMAPGSMIFVDSDAFTAKALAKVGFETNPLETDELASYRLFDIPLTTLVHGALEDTVLTNREKDRCKNFFALGLMYWVFNRPLEYTLKWLDKKFANKPHYADANKKALKAGYHYGETTELFDTRYEIAQAKIAPGLYRQITGNQATAFGLIAASHQMGLELFYGSYPITPASDILHELAKHKNFGVRTFQAEDEIAAVGSAIGAAFGGALAATCTSGPGVALKGEAIGLAVMTELPLVIANIQRGGPSTGLPTKTEQSDLNMVLYGRNGESPTPIVAAATPGDCFFMAMEAARIAVKYMTPVFFLSDGYIANGAEPWKIPDSADFPDMKVSFYQVNGGELLPYKRDEKTLARPWIRPGTAGAEHRIGGLEKEDGSGNVSYDPANHEHMIRTRAEKIARIVDDIPDAEVYGDKTGDTLLVGWGGTYGALRAASMQLRDDGMSLSHMHLRHLNPLPKNVEPMLRSFKRVIVAELNLGQLRRYLQSLYALELEGYSRIQGRPFRVGELVSHVQGTEEA